MEYIVWVFFGLICVALIAYFIFSFIKDKKKQKKIRIQEKETEKKTHEKYQEYIFQINEVIDENKNLLDSFIASIGKMKMGEVTKKASLFLESIYNSRIYLAFFKDNLKYTKFVKNLSVIAKTKSNLWEKKCQSQLSFFKEEKEKTTLDELTKPKLEKAIEIVKEHYYGKEQ